MNKTKRDLFSSILTSGFVLMLLFLTACSQETPLRMPTEDDRFRTPISESTLRAYRSGTPIANKVQAVIAARSLASTLQMENLEVPEVISVERLTLAEAKKKVEQPGVGSSEDIPQDSPVWLVVFEGAWQVHPHIPQETLTPPPPFHGCQYVWIAERNNGYAETGPIDCGRFRK